MGKDGDLWDDSVLIKAFDSAISKYKVLHSGSNAGEKPITDSEKKSPSSEADKNLQSDENELETTVKIGETAELELELSQVKEKSLLEQASSAICVDSSVIENGNIPPSDGNSAAKAGYQVAHMVASDVHSQNEAVWYSNAPEEYNQLMNKYYDLESQRQLVLQQLNQYANWNYQNPIPDASTSEEYQTSAPQQYDGVACYCTYGCQNWTVPNSSLHDSCLGGTCIGNSCNDILRESQTGNPKPPEDLDSVKTSNDAISKALLAAETALSSLKMEGNGAKDKRLGMEVGHFAESTESSTDLGVVLNAWYTAGFYTGKYCSEQSMEKRKHGQGL